MQVIKEASRKQQINHQVFPEKELLQTRKMIQNRVHCLNFNNFFTEVGPNLAQKIVSLITFAKKVVLINEIKEIFF